MSYEKMENNSVKNTQSENHMHDLHEETHSKHSHPHPVPPKVKKKRTGCLFAVGCFILLLVMIGGVVGGAFLYTPIKSFLIDRGIIKDSNLTEVKSSDSDKKQLNFTKSDSDVPESKIVDIVKNTMPSAVAIAVTTNQSGLRAGQKINTTEVIGSGFIVDKQNGYVVTNQHVACNVTTTNVRVITSNEKAYKVKAIYQDAGDDVAVLQVTLDKDESLPSQLNLSTKAVEVGQTVIAIGNPSGLTGSVSTGVLSGTGRNITASGACGSTQESKDYYEVYQTDAAINPGNSGGPLLNSVGDVIGVNSATSQGVQNISFSIPIERVIRKLEELKKFGEFKNPFLGVNYQIVDDVTSQVYNIPQGASVLSVLAGGPAADAGMLEGDVITEISGKKISFSLIGVISQFNVGDKVQVKVVRKVNGVDKELMLTATLADRSTFDR